LLEVINEQPDEIPEGIAKYLLFYCFLNLTNYSGVSNHEGNYSFVGLSGVGESSGFFDCGISLAISAQSEEKDGAWEFIRTSLSVENQIRTDFFPSVQAALEHMLELARGGELYYYGSQIIITQDDADKLFDLMNRITHVSGNDDVIIDIIREEAAYFFAGDKTAEDVARIIQNRVQTYVGEQS
jgi:multiple sugar transport system substrate-binding protein